MRVSFWQVFRINSDNSIEPMRRIRIGGVEFGPGVRFTRGVSFGGIDLSLYIGKDFEVEEIGEVWVVRSIYNQ
ncbi:MAG: Uncharacterized protein CEN87_531 [Parcubacteria group bacterium Licking1014_1]|nr:MAG: Uncharacterized protein CEN87_531 [Parcubacteria group bacterium Licking1014_1]